MIYGVFSSQIALSYFLEVFVSNSPVVLTSVPKKGGEASSIASHSALWEQVREELKVQFPGKVLDSVLNAVRATEAQGRKGLITIKVPSAFHQNFLKKRLAQIHKKTKALKVNIQFNIAEKTTFAPLSPPLPPSGAKKKGKKSHAFHPHWTFSSFIEGPGNCFAFSLAKSIAATPFKNRANPFFIYGPSGLGKTHLLHAIGNALAKEKPHLKALYLPAERFFNDCITHIRKNEMAFFREKYRKNIQVLLLDDIPILGRGESTQEEFFHTYESLKQAECQIVLTSDQRPKNIKGLKTRIKTRFEGGVVADIQAPDKDTLRAIIKAKAEALGTVISNEMVSHLTNMSTSSVRELEGRLNKIKMFCELRKQNLSLKLFKHIFAEELCSPHKDLILEETPACVFSSQIKNIQKAVCSHFHLSLMELKSPSREKPVVQARNIAIYLVKESSDMSLCDIGAFFGGRSHSTMLNSLKNIKKSIREDQQMQSTLRELKKALKSLSD